MTSRASTLVRIAFLAVLVSGLSDSAMTQDGPLPDTLDWRRYFPLEVGNQWQYRNQDFDFIYFTRWHIRSDTLIDEQSYFIIDISGYDEDLQPLDQLHRTDVIRYDTSNALIVRRAIDQNGSPVDVWWLDIPCGIDAPFNARHECTGTISGMDYFVDGLFDASYVIGTDTVSNLTLKVFDSLGGTWTLATDIGQVARFIEGASPVSTLVYVHIGGTSYGEPAVPTASDKIDELPRALIVESIFPNPFSTTVTLQIPTREPGRVKIEVFDVLGRRVREFALFTSPQDRHQLEIDGSGLAAGTYFVRLKTQSGVHAISKITRQ